MLRQRISADAVAPDRTTLMQGCHIASPTVAGGNTPFAHASRRDVGVSIVFRYVAGVAAGTLFHWLRDRLPFPQPELSALFAIFVAYNTLLLPTLLWADRLPIRLLYLAPAYCDVGIAFAFVHFTGGYLSPFLITPLLTVIGLNLVYLTDRFAGAVSFLVPAAALIGLTAAHRAGWLPVPVPYAAQLIADDEFFYTTFPPVLLLFTLGWQLARTTGGSLHRTINELLATNQQLLERMGRHSDHEGRQAFLRVVAESLGGEQAFVIPLSATGDAATARADVWSADGACEQPPALSEMAPSRRALTAGSCRVTSGARRVFPDCAVIRRTRTEGCWVTALVDERGRPIGLLGVLRGRPLRLDHKAEFLMRLFTVLAQAGLQRSNAELATAALREQLHHSRKMEAMGQLAGGVAHDFNNLLTVVLGASELLRTRLGDRPSLVEYACDIRAAGERAADLVRHLLSFARRAPVKPVPIDLHASLREVERLLAHTLDKKITIALELSAECATLLGDASQIQNALLNVALNARDAMPNGGSINFSTANRQFGRVDLAARVSDAQPGTFIEVICSDTGAGMSPEVAAKAFEPFFTTKPRGKGTGLGLAAVYGCVQAHGGFTEIDSRPGAGTSVRIVLPARRASAEPVVA